MGASPQWKIQFSPGRPATNPGSGPHPKVYAPPEFGATTDISTDAQSNNQVYNNSPHQEISGTSKSVNTPFFRKLTWRAYTELQNSHLEQTTPPPNTPFTYINVATPNSFVDFGPSGALIEEIPQETGFEKGLKLASDEFGSWYMSDMGLRKFDAAGILITTIPIPEAAAADNTIEGQTRIRASYVDVGPQSDEAEINYHRLDGTLESTIPIGGEDFRGQDVSRKGKIYGFVFEGGGGLPVVAKIIGYDVDGTKLFEIPPFGGTAFEPDGNQPAKFSSLVAYGEDYIIATTVHIRFFSEIVAVIPGGGGTSINVIKQSSTSQETYEVYDARTGAHVGGHDFGVAAGDRTDFPLLPGLNSIQNADSYNNLESLRRNAYYPPGQ